MILVFRLFKKGFHRNSDPQKYRTHRVTVTLDSKKVFIETVTLKNIEHTESL
jgi:hypothetical protein